MNLIITLTRAEGPARWAGTTHTARSFEEANRLLSGWQWQVPGAGYHKVDFVIKGDSLLADYSGRYDLMHWKNQRADLKAQVLYWLEHMTANGKTPDTRDAAREMFDQLEKED